VLFRSIHDYIFEQETDQGLNADGSGEASSDGAADRVDDQGNFDPSGELLLVKYRQSDARFYGVEAEIGYALLQGPVALQGRLFGDTAYGELQGGDDLPRMTPARIGLGLEADRGDLSASLDLIRVLKQGRVAALETETGGYTLLNASASYELPGNWQSTSLYLRGRNLLDEEARRATSFVKDQVPLPGASVIVGFEVKLM
jgi:iron complex outermembrane receptor protein